MTKLFFNFILGKFLDIDKMLTDMVNIALYCEPDHNKEKTCFLYH